MKRLISMQIAVAFACVGMNAAQLASETFTPTDHCDVRFTYPSGWTVTEEGPNRYAECTLEIRPANYLERIAKRGADVYTIELTVPLAGTFLQNASAAGFDFADGRWIIRGQRASETARLVRSGRWWGLTGSSEWACEDEHHRVVGWCQSHSIVLANRSGRIWYMRGGEGSTQAFEKIRASLEFIEQKPAN